MATNFPTSKDDLDPTRGTAGQTLGTPNHITHHQNEDDAIEALQDKVGIDSSADATSLDYKVSNILSIDPGHKHTIGDGSDVNITTPLDGQALLYDDGTSKWVNTTTSVPDASTGTKGITTMSVAPAVAGTPIAVGDNDGRLPTQDENDAIAGTGTPSSSNKFTTEDYQVFSPPGMIVPYAGSTEPTGWIFADGTTGLDSTVDTSLANLFTAIGTTYGGTGAADFAVPDLRGNFPLGKDNMGGSSRNRVTDTEADTLGDEAGEQTHVLTEAEMPSHTHTIPDRGGAGGSATLDAFELSGSVASGSAGSDTAHENMPPYMTLNYIIKK